ncbi:quinone oxidoreductase [Xanthobacter autotrophicus DSM 431]|uniref:quinone oxidoreductase family protein n=1 Tax=Xanthobacter nonsaccharivorans TaxID=3119912 RepID=UPI00372BADFA
MVTAVRVHAFGGPDVLVPEKLDVAAPGAGEVRLRQTACGVNFIDIYFRSGLNRPPALPFIPGNEAAGVVIAVGEGVTTLAPGDRVAYSAPLGGYAAERLMPAHQLVRIPDGISDEVAAAVLLKGTTAFYLLTETFRVEPGMRVLVQAAAGGVGLLLCQWAAHRGAWVIGTVGSREKAQLARDHGCHEIILYREEDFAERVRALTAGRLCDVAYDGVGQATFPAVLDCLRPRGVLASFGAASGPIRDLEVNMLAQKGSLYVTRPTGAHYLGTRHELERAAQAVFEAVRHGVLRVEISARYPLAAAASAHRDLESRATTGSLLLIP